MLALNLIVFQLVWIACVAGAARGYPWLGVAATVAGVLISLRGSPVPPVTRLFFYVATSVAGMCGEWLLHAAAVTGYPPQAWTGGPAPAWMVALWVNFATIVHVGLAWLRGRFVQATLAGAVAGPLSYWGGERLGAITLHPDPAVWVGAIGLLWGVATPLLVWFAEETAPS